VCPAQILDWIAWYPDGGLTDAERGAVEAHAATCPACREEIAVLAGRLEPAESQADAEDLFARVLARIEADGVGAGHTALPSQPVARRDARGRGPARVSRASGAWRRLAVGATAAGLALLLAGVGWLGRGWLGVAQGAVVYRTASGPAEEGPASGGGQALDVVFRSEASAEHIATVLRGLRATIVAGPSELGRYRIELPPGSDVRAAAALLRAEGTGVASYAEPAVRP
jgi:hypothetical protein